MPINLKPSLTKNQLLILNVLKGSPSLREKFYWTGGTLLAHCFLHHRNSLDMDFFSEKKFDYDELIPFLKKVMEESGEKIEEFKIYDRWEFVMKNAEKTRFEFVYYNHDRKRLKPLETRYGVLIDSLEDMAANKLMAFFDRNEPKDLFDIYFLLKKKFTLKKLLALAAQKTSVNFSEFMFWSECTKSLERLSVLKPLVFEKSLEKQDQLFKKINDYFETQGQDYLRKHLYQ